MHLSAAKRAAIFSHFMLGSVAMSAMFMSATGVMDVGGCKSLVYWGYFGIMENRMEATNIGIMEKKMETTIVI